MSVCLCRMMKNVQVVDASTAIIPFMTTKIKVTHMDSLVYSTYRIGELKS